MSKKNTDKRIARAIEKKKLQLVNNKEFNDKIKAEIAVLKSPQEIKDYIMSAHKLSQKETKI